MDIFYAFRDNCFDRSLMRSPLEVIFLWWSGHLGILMWNHRKLLFWPLYIYLLKAKRFEAITVPPCSKWMYQNVPPTQFSMILTLELHSIVIIQSNIWNISCFSYPLNWNACTNTWVYIIHETNILLSLSIILIIYLSIRRTQTINIW